jgi:hypothetical protein
MPRSFVAVVLPLLWCVAAAAAGPHTAPERIDGAYARESDTPEVGLSVAGEGARPLLLSPHAEFFLAGVRGERSEAAIDIISDDIEPLRLGSPQHPNTHFTSRLQAIEPGRHYRLSIALRADGPAGRQRTDITLATSSKAVPVLVIPAHTLLRERVYTFPESVDLGALPLSAIGANPALLRQNAQILMVYQRGGSDFRVTATTDVDGLSVRAERGPAGDRHQLTLQLDPAYATGPRAIRGNVLIETNDPRFPSLRVPITGALLAL